MIDLKGLTKQEILNRAKWKCPEKGHSSHNGLEHPRCYDKHKGIQGEKTLFLDIEAEDLNADYGIMFCWVAMDEETGQMFSDIINLSDIKKYSTKDRNKQPKEDSRIIKSLVDLLNNYNRVVTHYGSRYDLPFIRTRAVMGDIDFPSYGSLYQMDTWMIMKNKFKLSRNTLQNGCLKLLGVSRKDHLSLSIKHGCLRGEKWALDLTLTHCKSDVLDLRDIYIKINKFVKKSKTSI